MGIGPIADYNSFYANYRIPDIPAVALKEPEELCTAAAKDAVQEQPKVNVEDLSIEEKPEKRANADVHDMSLSFNYNEDYAYLGKDSDIENLDMQKAISDMKKDQVLQQYQYFVGSSRDLFSAEGSRDGMVFLKF